MKNKHPKPNAGLVISSVTGVLDKHKDLTDCCDAFEKTIKQYAKLHKLEIECFVRIWEVK